jgi:hypothetical protein
MQALPIINNPNQQGNRRKCGHCRVEGHNINRCPTLDNYIEELYHLALNQVHNDLRGGYSFENWVLNLSNRDMQYLVWKCQQPQHGQMAAEGRRTNLLRRISDVQSKTIVFEHFGSLNLGYVTQSVRLARHYYQGYRIVQMDVANGANGVEFQNYLKNCISEWEQRDIYSKIIETRGLVDSPIEEREFPILWGQWDRRPHSVLTNPEFIIHSHFAGIAELGYDFRVRNMPGYLDPVPQQPQHRVMRAGQAVPPRFYRREEPVVRNLRGELLMLLADAPLPVAPLPIRQHDSLHINFSENQSINLELVKEGPYPVSYIRDYKIVKEDITINACTEGTEGNDDCPVCLETKTQSHFLKMGCTHGFCNTCVGKIIITAVPKLQEVHCPLCRDKMREIHYSDYSKVKVMFKTA